MQPHQEIEWRLRTPSRPSVANIAAELQQLGCTVHTDKTQRLLDTYLDDARGSLWTNGLGLRLREGPGGREITCKRRTSSAAGLFVREEFSAPWPRGVAPHAAGDLPPALQHRVEPYALARPLVASLQLAIGREQLLLTLPSGTKATLTVDRVQLLAGERRHEFGEIELETRLLAEAQELAPMIQHLAARLGAIPATDDKPAHAASLLGKRPDANANHIDPGSPRAVLHSLMGAAQRAEEQFRGERTDQQAHRLAETFGQLHAAATLLPDAELATALAALEPLLAQLRADLRVLGHLDACLESWPTDKTWPAALRASAELLRAAWQRRRDERASALVDQLCAAARLHAWESMQQAIAALPTTTAASNHLATAVHQRLRAVADGLRQALPQAAKPSAADCLDSLLEHCELLLQLGAIQSKLDPASHTAPHLQRLRQLLQAAVQPLGALQQWAAALAGPETAVAPTLQAAAAGLCMGALHRAGRKARKRLRKGLPDLLRRRAWRGLLDAETQRGQDDATLA